MRLLVLPLFILLLISCATNKDQPWISSISHSDTIEVRRYLVYNAVRYQREENVRFRLFYKRSVLNMALYSFDDGRFLEDIPLQKKKVKALMEFEKAYSTAPKLFGRYYLMRWHKNGTTKKLYISEKANERLMSELGIYETIESLYRSLITSHNWYTESHCDLGELWRKDKLVLVSRKNLSDSVFSRCRFRDDQRLSFTPINGKSHKKMNKGETDGVFKWQVEVDRLKFSWRFKGIYKVCFFKIIASTPNRIVLKRDSGKNKYRQLY